MSNIKRQITGRRNKASGELFEKYIDRSCDYYRNKEIAVIEKTPEPFHIQKNLGQGRFMGNYIKQSQPDYKGALLNGQCIIFEAKHTDTDRVIQDRVTPEQTAALNRYEKMLSKCYVMVSFGLINFYRIPWKIWKNMKELYGRKYVKEADIEEYKLSVRNCTILMLEGVEINDY